VFDAGRFPETNERENMNGTVYVYKTLPKTLESDVQKKKSQNRFAERKVCDKRIGIGERALSVMSIEREKE
jgi:hypothetical protein